MIDFDTLPNKAGDLGKIIVATSFDWLPKVQKIAKSGRAGSSLWRSPHHLYLILPINALTWITYFPPVKRQQEHVELILGQLVERERGSS